MRSIFLAVFFIAQVPSLLLAAPKKENKLVCQFQVDDYSVEPKSVVFQDKVTYDRPQEDQVLHLRASYQNQEIMFVVSYYPMQDHDNLIVRILDTHQLSDTQQDKSVTDILKNELSSNIFWLPKIIDGDTYFHISTKLPNSKSVVASMSCDGFYRKQ